MNILHFSTEHQITNPLCLMKNGERHYCDYTLDLCKECGESPCYYKCEQGWAVMCTSCGSGTDYYEESWEPMVRWNKDQRGIKDE